MLTRLIYQVLISASSAWPSCKFRFPAQGYVPAHDETDG